MLQLGYVFFCHVVSDRSCLTVVCNRGSAKPGWDSILAWCVRNIFTNAFLILQPDYKKIAANCNIWRNYADIQDSWDSVRGILEFYGNDTGNFSMVAGPGNFNDPDMVGAKYEHPLVSLTPKIYLKNFVIDNSVSRWNLISLVPGNSLIHCYPCLALNILKGNNGSFFKINK